MSSNDIFLISLYRKEAYREFVSELAERTEFHLVGSSGTAAWCQELGVDCATIESVFDLSPRLSGQVKSLHPDLYTALLRPGNTAEELNIVGVAVDLTPGVGTDGSPRRKQFDIGGVSLLRGAVKNYEKVAAVSSPETAELYLGHFPPELETRKKLARKALERTLEYDSRYHETLVAPESTDSPPEFLRLQNLNQLRYGENPHQEGSIRGPGGENELPFTRIVGDRLSYTNCLDTEAALRAIGPGEQPEVSVIKHTNPTGWARAEDLETAISAAWEGDPKSAYGGVMGVNCQFTAAAAQQVEDYYLAAVVAPEFKQTAVDRIKANGSPRLIEWPGGPEMSCSRQLSNFGNNYLSQSVEPPGDIFEGWRVVSEAQPTSGVEAALRQMWRLSRWVTSNSAVVGTVNQALGVGAGQQSRVDAVRLATDKYREFHTPDVDPVVLASDGFFPFPDNLEVAAEAGVEALVAPGGSIRDETVISTADELDLVLVFTDRRIFSH